jgi:DNA-binding beta-propeller fold protein YncE
MNVTFLMTKPKVIFILLTMLLSTAFHGCNGQCNFGTEHLQLIKTILLPEVKGRIDHMDINLKDQILYVAALGNNTLEVVDLSSGKALHSIKGLDEPQGVGYISQTKEIFVANGGNGDCYFYNSFNFQKTGTIHLSSDADDVRYDSVAKKIYVGYGDGGIVVIDAETHKQLADFKLIAHPESFQIDQKLKSIYVNLPDAKMVGVIDLSHQIISQKWVRTEPKANFPMALDSIQHRVFVGYRQPARLIVFDGRSGKEISISNMAGDADDLYYDHRTNRVFVSGGAGSIDIFGEQADHTYKPIASVVTRSGARTSLLIPQLKLFVLAERIFSGKPADLLIYKIID